MYVDPVRTVIRPDPSDKRLLALSWQDYSHVLEQNKVFRDLPKKSTWARLKAQVPNNLIHQWLNEEYAKGNTKLRPFTREFRETVVAKKLADPNYKYLLV